MRTFIFSDLDGTLFDLPENLGKRGDLIPATVDRDGNPRSFMDGRMAALVEALERMGTIIPVTGRSSAALGRVLIPFGSWRIASYGAVIIRPDGGIDAEWRDRMLARLPAGRVARAFGMAERMFPGASARLVEEPSLGPAYVSVKGIGRLMRMHDFALKIMELRAEGFRDLLHGDELAIVPDIAGKEIAVAHLMERIRREEGPFLSFGLGDSPHDAAFMELCDLWIRGTGKDVLWLV